jgi:UDP-N-acetylglucosamine:LPS N-acetylglucosamine transferase
LPNISFCVFDEATRDSFFQVAEAEGKTVDPKRVIVTGPPLDPRVSAARDKKSSTSWRRRPVRILLTTGGLGTNKDELASVLKSLLPLTRRRNNGVQITYYAGTNKDHADMARRLAEEARVRIGNTDDRLAKLRILYADDLVVANMLLIRQGFPWADIVYTKPSGDMAYDAAAAGCALIFLQPWGEWERVISGIFQKLNIAKTVSLDDPAKQLETLLEGGKDSWLEATLERTRLLPPTYFRGSANILAAAKKAGGR